MSGAAAATDSVEPHPAAERALEGFRFERVSMFMLFGKHNGPVQGPRLSTLGLGRAGTVRSHVFQSHLRASAFAGIGSATMVQVARNQISGAFP